MKTNIYIPARYKSKRFPGKLLKIIKKKTILEHVAKKVDNINLRPIIITGDKKIILLLKKKKINFLISKKKHISGMSRVSEKIKLKNPKIIFLLFCDELYLSENDINKFIFFVKKDKKSECWHLLTNIIKEDKADKNVVKVELNNKSEIIDLSRKYKKNFDYKCVGLFAFKKEILINYCKFKNSSREIKMKVEQFKLLDNNIKIKSLIIKNIVNSINSINDLR